MPLSMSYDSQLTLSAAAKVDYDILLSALATK